MLPGVLAVGGITFSKAKVVVILGAIVVMAALYFFMKTKTGTAMLAAAENRDVAGLQGINAKRIFLLTMGVKSGLCGIAGGLIVPVLSAWRGHGNERLCPIDDGRDDRGHGQHAGALLAAFVVGIIESFAFQLVGQINLLVVFLFAAVLMYFRPGGLLGKPLPIPGQ